MVDGDQIINPEGFYNYLTGWYNVDNMMFYVSQAAFFPSPPGWGFNPKAGFFRVVYFLINLFRKTV